MQVYNLLTDALSAEIGPMRTDGAAFLNENSELDKIIIGTSYGKYIVAGYNLGFGDYEILWDSGEDDQYTMETGIWDMVHIDSTTDIPIFKISEIETTNPAMPDPVDYNSWSVVDLDPYDLTGVGMNIIFGTKNGMILAANNYGEPDLVAEAHLAPINIEIDPVKWPYTSVEPLSMPLPSFASPALAIGLFNPDVDPISSDLSEASADILFAYRTNPNLDFDLLFLYLNQVDTTGELTTLVRTAKTTPKMKFTDYDSDGDFDMILSIGKLYLAECSDTMYFTLVPGYFDDINAEVNSNGWGQPDLIDLNQDGTQDIIVNHAFKYGATIYLNFGTDEIPQWEQQKSILTNNNPETNIKLMNLTDGRIIPAGDRYFTDSLYDVADLEFEKDFHLIFYNGESGSLLWAEPEYEAIDSYLVCTYPLVSRMDFSLVGLDDEYFSNIGFHVRESWNNDFDLEGWTLSIASGDIDGDGIGELIVGDYDNNMYAFEFLLDNTYKRMYQSPDLTHEEDSTESPYLYDDLEGISGEFIRKIWDHAEYLLANVDLDQDGLKEILVVANLQVHIFEDADLFGGDYLNYINTIDLRESSFEDGYGWDQLVEEKITAITSADDLDYDGNPELILAAGPYLFVLNIQNENYESCLDDGLFVTNNAIEGRYALIGNPNGGTDFRYAVINALTTGDTDEDGYKEIILGGILDKRYIYQEGFAYIYESQGGTFYKAWEAPSEVVHWNPVSTLDIDDQDYDSAQEIIIGHSQGFDIWEWQEGTDSIYFKTEYVTSNPNYPIIAPSTTHTAFDQNYSFYVERGYNSLAKGKGVLEDYTFSLYTNFSSDNIIETELYWKFYLGGAWTNGLLFITDKSYTTNLISETEPSIIALENGDFWATWRTINNIGQSQIWVREFDADDGGWQDPVEMSELTTSHRTHPKVFDYSATHIGVVYTRANSIGYAINSKETPGTSSKYWVDFPDRLGFVVQSSSITQLPSGEFVIAMSAINNLISKPDYDIWTLTIDSNFDYSETIPHQATTSYEDETNPDITYLENPTGAAVIVYENVGAPYDKRFGIVGSTNKGFSWKRQNNLGSIHEDLRRIESVESNSITWEYYNPETGIWEDISGLFAPLAISPAITALNGEGFIYTFTQAFSWVYLLRDETLGVNVGRQYYGLNLQSDWILNDLTSVVDLDVGDTDNDGRREIIVGWDSQVSVYELNSSVDAVGDQYMDYTQDWLSDPFDNEFTALTVYDTNGNGWEEIGIATKRGNVYLLENPDPSEGPLNMYLSEEVWNRDSGILPDGVATSTNIYNFDYDSWESCVEPSIIRHFC